MTFEPRDPDFAQRVRRSFAAQQFMAWIGAEIVHLQPGEVDVACASRPELGQQHGFFHGGVTSAVADSSAGFAALSLFEPGSGVLTTEYKVNLLAPGRGSRLIARGRVIKSGRTLTVCRSDIFAESAGDEVLIATGLFTMMQVAGLTD